MGGRGSMAVGGNRVRQFVQTGEISGSQGTFKVLETNGKCNQHGLSLESDTSHGYIKLKNGKFHELRIYGPDHRVLLEIGYHGEKSLTGDYHKKILHYQTLSHGAGNALDRSTAVDIRSNMELYEKYKDYFVGIEEL